MFDYEASNVERSFACCYCARSGESGRASMTAIGARNDRRLAHPSSYHRQLLVTLALGESGLPAAKCLSHARMEFPRLLPTGGRCTQRPSASRIDVGTPFPSPTPTMSATG